MVQKGSESRGTKDSLGSLFEFNQSMFLGNTKTILQINSTLIPLAEFYLDYLKQKDWKDIKNMPIESLKQYLYLAYALFEQQHIANKGITEEIVKSAYEKLQHRVAVAIMLPKFIREMSFVYLTAKFEDFISKELQIVFIRRHEVLKPIPKDKIKADEKKVTYQEVFSASNLDELKDRIAEREIKRILMQDLENINEDLKHYLKFDLSYNNNNWKAIKERFQRRNILLHNNGRVNATYREKTGEIPIETHLSVDERYLSKSITLFETYCNEITNKSLQTFAKKKI